MASDSFSYFANKVGMKCNKTERGMHWTRELLELGTERNLGSLHPEEPSGRTNTTSRHKGVCLVWLVPGVLLFHLHPHSRHTLGCSFAMGHCGEENKTHKWEFYFSGKLREDKIPGPGVDFPWFYSQPQLDQPFRQSITVISEAFPAGHGFCSMCSSHSMFLRLRCSLETQTKERGEWRTRITRKLQPSTAARAEPILQEGCSQLESLSPNLRKMPWQPPFHDTKWISSFPL